MKLHIGGEQVKEGWKILNAQQKPGVDFIGDICDLSQFSAESMEAIYASHVLEHVSQPKMLATLQGVHRVLRTDGKFYVSVPDMDILAHTFISPIATIEEKFKVMCMMFGAQGDDFDYHHFGWNQLFMWDFLTRTGFSNAERVVSFGLFDDTSNTRPFGFPISLNVIATK